MKLKNLSKLTALLLALMMSLSTVAASAEGLDFTETDYNRALLESILALPTPQERSDMLLKYDADSILALMWLYYDNDNYGYMDAYPEYLCYCFTDTLHPYGSEEHAEDCPWHGTGVTLTDEATGITVTGDIPEGVELVVETAAKPSIETLITMIDPSKYAEEPNVLAYNITLTNADGTPWQPAENNTTVTVTVPGAYTTVPEKPLAEAVHMTGDTTFEVLPATANADGSVTFEATGFSDYYIVAGTQSESLNNDVYYILPGSSVNITNAGSTKPTVTDENGVTVEEPSWLEIEQNGRITSITVSPTAPTDKTYSYVLKYSNSTVTIHIVSQQTMVGELLTKRSDVFLAIIQNSTRIPEEPTSAGNYTYYYVTKNGNNFNYSTSNWTSPFTSTSSEIINTEKLPSASFQQSMVNNKNILGATDSGKTGSLKDYLVFDDEYWHSLLMGIWNSNSAAQVTIQTLDGAKSLSQLTEEDLAIKINGTYRYQLVPYVIKVLVDGSYPQYGWSDRDDGWHIDCCIVDTLTYSVSYNHNLPSTVTLPSNLYVPATKFYAPKSTPPVEAMTSDSSGNNRITSIKVYDNLTQGDVTYTFQGWDADGDGDVDYHPDDTLDALESNVELVAIWTTNAESGTVRLTKQADFTKAPGHSDEGAEIEYEFTITYPANAPDSEPPKRPYSIETPNGATVRGEFEAGAENVTIKIKHDQTLILHNVTPGTVTIIEPPDASYEPTWTGAAVGATPNVATVTVEKGKTTSVVCTNTYAPQTANLTIIKQGMTSGNAVVTVSLGNEKYTVVLNSGNGWTATIADLAIGSTWTVAELDAWTWQYTNTTGPVTHKIQAGENEVTIINDAKPDKWLHDESITPNVFTIVPATDSNDEGGEQA